MAALSNFKDVVFGGSGFSLDVNFQNRNTDWAEIPHSDSLNITHELTILAWIRPDDIENNDGIVTKGRDRVSWALHFNNTNGLRFTANDGFNLTDPTDPNYSPTAVGTGDRQSLFNVPEVNAPLGIDWSFVGVVSDTKSLRFFLNLEQEVLPASYIFAESNEPLILGCYLRGQDYFNGLIDEVRIYNRSLSGREVIAISGLARKPFEPEPADGAKGVRDGTLSWGRIEGTDKLYVGTDPNTLAPVSEGTTGSYAIAQLAAGQKYFWRVDVVTANATVTGDIWSFTVAQNAASTPQPSDGAEFAGVAGVSLDWLPALGATAYKVYMGTDPAALGLLGQVSQASYDDPSKQLPSGTLHYWRVDAVKDSEVTTGPVWSFQTMPIFVVGPDLAAWYKFDRGEGTVAIDWTRRGNDGTLVGDTKWIEEGCAGRALEFDGAGDYVEIPRVVQDDWTIMLWLRTDDPAQTHGTLARVRNGSGLIDGDAGGQINNFAMSLNQRKVVVNCMATAQGDGNALASNVNIDDTDWHHAAWIRTATTGEMALFIDGALDNSGQQDKWKGTKDAQSFIWIGGLQYANNQNYFKGQLDEVKFFTRVLNAGEITTEMRPDKRQPLSPKPVPGSAVKREEPVLLAWGSGEGATTHNVYLGTREDDLQLVGPAQAVTQYDAGVLQPGTWYWRVGEVQADGAEVKGELWNFIVPEYVIVDDFEDYNDYPPHEIYTTWKDGYEKAENGSQVGNLSPPSVETTFVHGGAQSMPLLYSNTSGAMYSEATRTFAIPQDWTNYGIQTLGLWFRGAAGNTGQLYVKINSSTVLYDGSAADLAIAGWQPWNIDLTTLGVNLQSVSSLIIGIDGNGASGTLLVDDIRLYPLPRQFVTPVDPGTTGLQAQYQFEGNANDSSGKGRNGTAQGGPLFVAGKVGQAISLDGIDDYVTIAGYKGIPADASGVQQPFTIAAWVKTIDSGDRTIASWGTNSNMLRVDFRLFEGRLRVEHGGGNVQGDTTLNDGNWHHVALTIIQGATISYPDVQLWLDGKDNTRASTDPDAFSITAGVDVAIGYRATAAARYFLGAIDDVCLYDRVLTQEEIAWLAGLTKPFDKPF
jgi:hypothetical protein